MGYVKFLLRSAILLAALLAGFTAARAQNSSGTMKILTKAEAQQFSYSWTDAQGTKHISDITEEATDPYQIWSLLREIYTNQNIPGTIYAADGTETKKVNYTWPEVDNYYELYRETKGGPWIVGKDPIGSYTFNINKTYSLESGKDYTPYVEGYTTLIVKLKDSFNSNVRVTWSTDSIGIINNIRNCIQSVQLITEGGYLAGDKVNNPGALYKLTGKAGRFFFISKGRARKSIQSGYETVKDDNGRDKITNGDKVWKWLEYTNMQAPFMGLFEEYSPVALAKSSKYLTDFYARMRRGDIYKCEHDCNSVLQLRHHFSMTSDGDTTQAPADNIAFFIPDKRLTNWAKRDYNDISLANRDEGTNNSPYANYNPDYAPSLGLYTLHLDAEAKPSAVAGKYTVTLTWISNLDRITNETVAQKFRLWIVGDDGQLKRLTPTVNEDSLVTYVYQYDVPQQQTGYNITYRCDGEPTDGDYTKEWVWSNDASVVIPGLDAKERFLLSVTPQSDYYVSSETNQYLNTVHTNYTIGRAIDGSSLAGIEGLSLKLYRYNPKKDTQGNWLDEPEDQGTQVANVVFDASNKRYTLTNLNQTGSGTLANGTAYNHINSSAYPAPTGNYSIKDTTMNGHTFHEVDFGNTWFADQFEADTRLNEHPARYWYRLVLSGNANLKDPDGQEYDSFYSSYVPVNVFKTTATAAGDQRFTREQVDADKVNGSLLELTDSKATLTMTTQQNDVITRYSAKKLTNQATDQATDFGTARSMSNGQYQIYNYSNNSGTTVENDTYEAPDDNFSYGTHFLYPVISTYRSDDQPDNTYGGQVAPLSKVGVTLTAEVDSRSEEVLNDNNSNSGKTGRYFTVNLVINNHGISANAGTDNEPYMWRIWRVLPDGQAMEVNNRYKDRLNGGTNSPITVLWNAEAVKPEFDHQTALNLKSQTGSETWGADPAYTAQNRLTVQDRFGAVEPGRNGTPVTYIVRLYAKANVADNSAIIPRTAAPSRIKRIDSDLDGLDYCIAQATATVTLTSNVRTAIDNVAGDKAVAGVTYYNLAGQQSSQPFSGVNIVVTRYTDGSQETAKRVIR